MAPSLTRAISYTFWQRESRNVGIESKCLKKIVNYKRSLCCSGSWYLSPGGQSPGWVTQQVRIKQNKVPGSSMSRSVERTHQGAHSSNTQVHTKETSPAFSCFSCFYFPLSFYFLYLCQSITHSQQHTGELDFIPMLYELQTCYEQNMWQAYWCFCIQFYEPRWSWSDFPYAWHKIRMACWSTCFAGVLMNASYAWLLR